MGSSDPISLRISHCRSARSLPGQCERTVKTKLDELLRYLRRQFTYDEWASREVLANLRTSARPPAQTLKLLAHILSAERLWLERIRKQPQSLPVWPEFSADQCETQIAEMTSLWREYLGGLSEKQLSESVSYKNSKGEPWSGTVQDILTHVLLHSAYHRGQIASHTRAGEETPAYTDFIHAVRQGFIE